VVQTTDDTNQEKELTPKTKKAPERKSAKKTAAEVEEEQQTTDPDEQDPLFISARPEGMDTAAINSAPHPELWPFPDTDPDADSSNAALTVKPEAPSVNFEFTINATGLPANSGVVFQLDHVDNTGEPTFLTNKTDPQGNASLVWRSQVAGTNTVTVLEKNDNELGSEIVSADFEVIDPAEDRRLGEERGTT
jgi:hypothetical protein